MCHVTDIFTAPSETKKQIITSRIILNESDLYYDLYTCTIYMPYCIKLHLLEKSQLDIKVHFVKQAILCRWTQVN